MKRAFFRLSSWRFHLPWPARSLGTRLTLSIGLVIALTSLILFIGVYRLEEQQAIQHINTEARALLTEMVVLREWVASYEGVWTTRPGDFHLDSKDGYYLKSPAMVTKELSKLSDNKGYYRFHITSLKLVNPENAPDDFEHDALLQFERNPVPLTSVDRSDGTPVYRLMIPLRVEENCLNCHAAQGYQVGDIRGGLSVLVPMAEMDLSLANSRQALILSAVSIVALVMAALYILVRRMVIAPVSRLKAVAAAVGRGDYEVRCDLRTGDELEVLGGTLNQMVRNLKASRDSLSNRVEQRTRELSAISDVALIISRAGNLEDVLDEALVTVIRVVGAGGGLVHLAEKGGARLAAHQGLSNQVVNCFESMQEVNGYVRKVLQRGEPIHIPGLDFDVRQKICPNPVCPAQAEGYQSLVSVPLSSRSRSLGTLTLFSREPAGFSPETMQLLVCIGHQLGVAVENAWFHDRTQQMAILEERNRISRELHDSLAQTLGWLNIKTEVLDDELKRGEIERSQADVASIRRVVRDACYDVRESIDGLRTHPTDGLITTAAAWISEFRKRSGLAIEFRAADSEMHLSAFVEFEMMRILQEALTNVRKHAQANRVCVDLLVRGDVVELIVEDDGRGFVYRSAPDAGHFGLRIMRERAEGIGGTFQVEAKPGKGTRVIVRLPTHSMIRSELR